VRVCTDQVLRCGNSVGNLQSEISKFGLQHQLAASSCVFVVFIYYFRTMFRDNIVAACWRLTNPGFGNIRMRKCDVDVAANIRNGCLRKCIHFLCCCIVSMRGW
jgi:hypothetical protein